ncbi:unnamed protein product [Heterobilharzia americana]|nr:unnamed protein product [Heterobilharzia americana]
MNQFINDEIASDKQNMYSLITDLIHLLLSSKFKEVWSNLINDRKISYNQLLTNLNQILLYMSTFNTPDQVSQCHVLIKSINTDVASYSLNFKINNNCSINTTNSVTLNIYQTNYAQDTRYSQFKFTPNPVNVQRINNSKQGQQQNLSIIGGLSVLTILDENLQDSKNLMLADIPLNRFSQSTQLQEISLKDKQSLHNDRSQVNNDQRVFLIASPLYSVEFFTTNQSETILRSAINNDNSIRSIQIDYMVPLLKQNKYQSVYYYQTTGRMKWKAYSSEQSNDRLANQIRCVYWENTVSKDGEWDVGGCRVVRANITHVQCVCSHLSLFAVAMESEDAPYRDKPIWKAWGIETESQLDLLMNIILLGGNGLSLACSALFLLTLITVLKKSSIPDVCLARIGLCICQLGFHVTLFVEPLMNKQQTACQAIGLSMNLFTILVSSWLANEAISCSSVSCWVR